MRTKLGILVVKDRGVGPLSLLKFLIDTKGWPR